MLARGLQTRKVDRTAVTLLKTRRMVDYSLDALMHPILPTVATMQNSFVQVPAALTHG
jgi:hypothetical protein